MTSNEEEEDYMSDAFLARCEDNRPGLLSSNLSKKYEKQQKTEKKHKLHREQYKPRTVLEKEKREEGLKLSIGSDNKGYAMLAKMGYKPGMAIGRAGMGRREPVSVEVKLGRGGLGREADQKRKQQARSIMRSSNVVKRQRVETNLRNDFVQRMGSRFTDRKDEADLRKSQKVCEQLDAESGIKKPEENFYWPEEFHKKVKKSNRSDILRRGIEEGYDAVLDEDTDDDDEDEEDDSDETEEESTLHTPSEMLAILTSYLRNKYIYCVWCGTKYDDAADLESNCPGDTAAVHDE